MFPDENIHPEFHRMLGRDTKEKLLGHRGLVVWLYGLSGSGKSTLARALEVRLHGEGVLTCLLDGDNIRTGLNRGLGFTDEDRLENIRRVAEVAKLFAETGVVALTSLITPTRKLRALARRIVGDRRFWEIYVKCSFEACAARDVKGLYAKADTGQLKDFTGRDSTFEEPEPGIGNVVVIDTENAMPDDSADELYKMVRPLIK